MGTNRGGNHRKRGREGGEPQRAQKDLLEKNKNRQIGSVKEPSRGNISHCYNEAYKAGAGSPSKGLGRKNPNQKYFCCSPLLLPRVKRKCSPYRFFERYLNCIGLSRRLGHEGDSAVLSDKVRGKGHCTPLFI